MLLNLLVLVVFVAQGCFAESSNKEALTRVKRQLSYVNAIFNHGRDPDWIREYQRNKHLNRHINSDESRDDLRPVREFAALRPDREVLPVVVPEREVSIVRRDPDGLVRTNQHAVVGHGHVAAAAGPITLPQHHLNREVLPVVVPEREISNIRRESDGLVRTNQHAVVVPDRRAYGARPEVDFAVDGERGFANHQHANAGIYRPYYWHPYFHRRW